MQLSRRQAMKLGGATVAVSLVPVKLLAATEAFQAAIDEFTGGASVGEGGITLTAPEIAENGNTVPVKVSAPGAKRILMLAEGNPAPGIAQFNFSSMAVPEGSTRIRLATSQNVVAIAEMADGSYSQVASAVKVTIGGCGG